MSDEWLVDVLGQIAAYADHSNLDWLHPLMDAAHNAARRELIFKGSVSLKGFQAVVQSHKCSENEEPREVRSAQVIDFEQFRLRRADVAPMTGDHVGFSAN